MRQVLQVAYNFPPSSAVGALRAARFARDLPGFGWQPHLLVGRETQHPDPIPEWIDPAHVTWVSLPVTPGSNRASASTETASPPAPGFKPVASLVRWLKNCGRNPWQLLTETPDSSVSWARAARARARQLCRGQQFDALLSTGPPHSTHLVTLDLKRRYGWPWIADLRDPVARHPWGERKNPWAKPLRLALERRIIHTADRVVLNSPGMLEDFRRHYGHLPAEKFHYIPNGADDQLRQMVATILAELPSPQPRLAAGDASPPTLIHPGSLYHRRNPRNLMQAIAILRQRGIPVRFTQVGAFKPEFEIPVLSRQLGIEDLVEIQAAVPRQEAYRRMANSQLLLLLQPDTELQIPAKLYEFMLFRRPILAISPSRSIQQVISDYQLGMTVDNHNPAELADTIAQLLQRYEEFRASPGWDRAQVDFDGTRLSGQLAQLLDDISPVR
ncbi:MAG: glycosyltransferase [Planctomycetaceae bacterium]